MNTRNVINPALLLTADEQELLELFRAAQLAVKAEAINALHGMPWAPKPRAKEQPRRTTAKAGSGSGVTQTFHGTVNGGVAGGNIISHAAPTTTVKSQTNHGDGGIVIGAVHGDVSVIQIERLKIDRLKTCAFLRDLEARIQRQQEGAMA